MTRKTKPSTNTNKAKPAARRQTKRPFPARRERGKNMYAPRKPMKKPLLLLATLTCAVALYLGDQYSKSLTP